MRIVITGGSGYLAGRIIEKLLSCRDYEITSISQGKSQLYLDNKIKYFSWDQKEDIHNAISNANIVLHTAGFNALDAAKHPDKAKDFSHKSTKSIINSLNPESSTKLIFFSTAHVYKSHLIGEINEDTLTTNNHPYALSNLVGESITKELNLSGKKQGIILRIGNCFGLPASELSSCWDLAINGMCKSAILNRQINISGPSNEIRNFIPMRTFLEKLLLVIKDKSNGYSREIINISYTKSYTLGEIAKMISDRCFLLFNFTPKIICEQIKKGSLTLNYHSKYIETLPEEENHFLEEIDETLIFLKNNYD